MTELSSRKGIGEDFRHTLWTLSSVGVNALLGFAGGLILITGLSVGDYGTLSPVLAVIIISQEFVGQGINDSMVRLGTLRVSGSFRGTEEVFRAGLFLKICFCFPVGILLWCFPFPGEYAISAMVAISGNGLWTWVLTRRQAAMDFYSLAMARPVNNLMRISLLLLLLGLDKLSLTGVLCIIGGCFWVSSLIVGWKDLLGLGFLSWSPGSFLREIRPVFRYAVWGVAAGFAFVAFGRMDLLVLTRFYSPDDVAVYNAAWQVLIVIDLMTISIMTAMMPKACHKTDFCDLKNWCIRCLGISMCGVFLSLPLYIFADFYVPLFFPEAYARSIPLLKIMYPSYVLSLLIFPMLGLLYARNKFHVSGIVHILFFLLSIPVYVYVIRTSGLYGAAWGHMFLRSGTAMVLGITYMAALFEAGRGGNKRVWEKL